MTTQTPPPVFSDAHKMEMANKAAGVMIMSIAGVPSEIQLEASIVAMRTLFISHVKPKYRLSLFGSVSQKLREQLKQNLKTGVMP